MRKSPKAVVGYSLRMAHISRKNPMLRAEDASAMQGVGVKHKIAARVDICLVWAIVIIMSCVCLPHEVGNIVALALSDFTFSLIMLKIFLLP